MVAITKLFPSASVPETKSDAPRPGGAISRLKTLHAEAEETARLANILGRSLYAGLTLPVMAILTVGLSVEVSPGPQLIWCLFVGAVSVAVLLSYRHAMRQPFERNTLKNFTKDLSATLLFAGFAWGAGAFLALPAGTPAVAALVFTAVPALSIAYLLRDREALFLFLAPSTVLTAAACLLKPFADGLWLAGATLAVGAAIAAASFLYEKLTGEKSKPAMLSLPKRRSILGFFRSPLRHRLSGPIIPNRSPWCLPSPSALQPNPSSPKSAKTPARSRTSPNSSKP